MTLINIVDHRENAYKWKEVYGVIEPTKNDNSVNDADIIEDNPSQGIVEYSHGAKSFNELIAWAQSYRKGEGNFTLYIYSKDPSPFAAMSQKEGI